MGVAPVGVSRGGSGRVGSWVWLLWGVGMGGSGRVGLWVSEKGVLVLRARSLLLSTGAKPLAISSRHFQQSKISSCVVSPQCVNGNGACPDTLDSNSCPDNVRNVSGFKREGLQCVAYTRSFVSGQ